MKRLILLLCAFAAAANGLSAQHLQHQLLSGTEKMVFQTTYNQQWSQDSNIRISGLAFFNRFHKSANEKFNETVIQTTVTGSFGRHFSAGPNLFYSSVAGLQPGILFNGKFQLFGIRFKVSPQLAYNVPGRALQGGLTFMAGKSITINRLWQLGANAFLMGSWLRLDTHDRSIVQLRLGPVYKKRFQFGLSYDLDQYSSKVLQQDQFGLFIRTRF